MFSLFTHLLVCLTYLFEKNFHTIMLQIYSDTDNVLVDEQWTRWHLSIRHWVYTGQHWLNKNSAPLHLLFSSNPRNLHDFLIQIPICAMLWSLVGWSIFSLNVQTLYTMDTECWLRNLHEFIVWADIPKITIFTNSLNVKWNPKIAVCQNSLCEVGDDLIFHRY